MIGLAIVAGVTVFVTLTTWRALRVAEYLAGGGAIDEPEEKNNSPAPAADKTPRRIRVFHNGGLFVKEIIRCPQCDNTVLRRAICECADLSVPHFHLKCIDRDPKNAYMPMGCGFSFMVTRDPLPAEPPEPAPTRSIVVGTSETSSTVTLPHVPCQPGMGVTITDVSAGAGGGGGGAPNILHVAGDAGGGGGPPKT